MRISKALTAAGLALTAVTMGTAAQAHDYNHGRYDRDHRYEREYRDGRYDRDHRDYDHDRRYGWGRGYGHRHCWTEWHYHHRVTVCR
ncbi:hypothetical protein ACLB0R_10460 [Sphingomonas sp. GlSt437]|uniref:hypothetical protein n=1 Tax=Sphingomonas sp. GlSt437 TaxID=3389970 RepID=UPI003A89C9DC